MRGSREQKPRQADQDNFSQQCSHMEDPHPKSQTFQASKTPEAYQKVHR